MKKRNISEKVYEKGKGVVHKSDDPYKRGGTYSNGK
jgi:hypothetical protein